MSNELTRRRAIPATLLVAIPIAGGCLPATYTQVPEIRGRIVDANGHPCANAEVRISEQQSPSREWTCKADAQGSFRQAEVRAWGIAWLVPTDMRSPTFRLSAARGDRSTRPITFDGGDLYHPHYLGFGNAAPKIDVGEVRLE